MCLEKMFLLNCGKKVSFFFKNQCFLDIQFFQLLQLNDFHITDVKLLSYQQQSGPKLIKYILLIKASQQEMLRHQRYQNNPETQHPRAHKKSNSNSTQDDLQKSIDAKSNKLKSQLCKKFMEKGYCPYEKRCKFAHGLKELRKNNQVNSKYKTKQCGSFKNNQFCIYGDRCNFIHVKGTEWKDECKKEVDASSVDVEMELIRTVAQKQSRLLGKLF